MKNVLLCIFIFFSTSVLGAEIVNEKILQTAETGPYAELSVKDNPNKLTLVYIPAITLLLERAKEIKGKSLSEKEIQRIRAGAGATAMHKDVAINVVKERGGIE